MTTTAFRAFAFAFLALACATPASAATATPHPKIPAVPLPRFPNRTLHSEFTAEVNSKGQVVRAKTVKPSHYPSFDAQTYGNVLQMWIRHPDGSAQVGLYKITYDYSPATKSVRRGVSLVKSGGSWGAKEGAADQMMDLANKEARGAKLPPLDRIIGSPSPHP
ncbi:MAG: hypothetical protein M3R51_09210 [Candidatus Eremiobacteraeota bacterium]|nr:hypothetical protein [Candidatus Eremiobacteraeota bacterium]